MERKVSVVFEHREGRKWVQTAEVTDEVKVYRHLSEVLIAKCLCKAAYVKRIQRRSNYDGTVTIIATYDNDCRNVFTVPCY